MVVLLILFLLVVVVGVDVDVVVVVIGALLWLLSIVSLWSLLFAL